jgi:hypothetical protein
VDLPIRKDHQLLYVQAYTTEEVLSQELSAGIGDYFRNVTIDVSAKNPKLTTF